MDDPTADVGLFVDNPDEARGRTMMLPKVAGDAATAVAIAFSTLLVGFVVAPTSTPALTARDAPTTADTDNTPTRSTDGVARAPIPRVIPGVGIIPSTGF